MISMPPWRPVADGDSAERACHVVELRRVGGPRDNVADASAVDAVLQICGRQQRRSRGHDETELDRVEQRFPESDFVTEHQQQAVALPGTKAGQEIGNAIRCDRELREGTDGLSSVLLDEMKGWTGVIGRDDIEVVERPVEMLLSRPFELA